MNTFEHNRVAWNRRVRAGDRWTVAVSTEETERARSGDFEILLTPLTPVPQDWIGELHGIDVLCLASGGGQQGPLLAAAGAVVTVFDASEAQLEQDRLVAARDGIPLRTVQGDMRDLGTFTDQSFDLIVNPCSNCFVENIRPVWHEAFRVLRVGGHLLAGFSNPISYCFDPASVEAGDPKLTHSLPYRDIDHLDDPYVEDLVKTQQPLEFSHTLTEQIAGQLDAGFALVGLYEDRWGSGEFPDPFFDGFVATRARKPG